MYLPIFMDLKGRKVLIIGGTSPRLAAKIRNEIENTIADDAEIYIEETKKVRDEIKLKNYDNIKKSKMLKEIAEGIDIFSIELICLVQNRNTQYCQVIYTVLQRKYNQYITLFSFIKHYISMLLNVLLFIYSFCNIVYF